MHLHVPLPSDPSRSTVYVDWVRATDADPAAEAAALAVVDEVGASIASAYPKTGRCVDVLERRALRLPPAHLPWFWDTVGHRLISWHPRSAARAYTLARKAEREQKLPMDADRHRANVLLYAREGALPVKELNDHQRWLAGVVPAVEAHDEYVRVLTAWAASPGELPADLARRVRASARAAGLGTDEDARVLGHLLASAAGKAVPDGLLDAAAALLADHPQDDAVNARLLDLFPETRNDASAWLRLLLRSGAADAVVAGRLTPEGGLAAWLGRYTRAYSHGKVVGGGVMRQPMPPELFELVGRFGPRLRAAGTPVRLHEDRYGYPGLDADLLDLCLAEGMTVEDPGGAVRLEFWGEQSRRGLKALAADAVFGRRLEGTVHAGLRGGGTAITRLPQNEGIAAEVHTRIESLLGALRGGGLAAADEALEELRDLLDRPTATALDGIEEALAELDLSGPLARALRAGLPEELGWPALDEALAGFGPDEMVRVTSTWPVLTVYGSDRAVAVDHAGRRGTCTFRVPDDATLHTVHYAGGQFLVSWTTSERYSFGEHAFWADHPDDVFEPENLNLEPYGGITQGGFGFQFESPDGGGRHDGERVLRPGDRHGIGDYELQMSDGHRFWSAEVFHSRGDWTQVDPLTGERGSDRTLPDFHRAREVPPGMEEFGDGQTLAALPQDAPPSPLGQDGRLVGCRVLNRTPYAGPSPTAFLLENIDGRSARYRSRRPGRRPWGIVGLPEGGEYAVLVGQDSIRCHAAEDNSLLWQVHGFPGSGRKRTVTFGEDAGPVPPPAFWHFLTPRDPSSSKTLRTVADGTARALVEAAVQERRGADVLPATVARMLPEVTEPTVIKGVLRAARLAADVLHRREELSRRVGIMRSGPVVAPANPVADTVLTPALCGLLPDLLPYEAHVPQAHPALQTAIAADGRYLRGEIDDETRRLALPAEPAEWAVLVGRIDAVAWRVAVETTSTEERAALSALLETWSGQPFAEPGGVWRTGRAPDGELAACRSAGETVASGATRGGLARFLQRAADPAPAAAEECETSTVAGDDRVRLPRLLELVAQHGPLVVPPEAVALFCARTGVRRSIAALVLVGLPQRERYDDHLKMLGMALPKVNQNLVGEYGASCQRLGAAGRGAVLAAGVPQDPAELWAPGGVSAAAERMAAVWAELLGAKLYMDEELAAALEADLGLSDVWARTLTTGAASASDGASGDALPGTNGSVLVRNRDGGIDVHHVDPDGTAGAWVPWTRPAHKEAASVVAWALTERPVGDPTAEGAVKLYEQLRARFDDPRTLIPIGQYAPLARAVAGDAEFAPYRGEILPCPKPLADDATDISTVYDDGLLVVAVPRGEVFVRSAMLAEPERVERALRFCDEVKLPWLREDIVRLRGTFDGLDRMAARAAATPVSPGGYEMNPALSTPDLVAEAARSLGVGADAAALYLQLLALARPTDKNVRRWNGWSAARHKAAQAELVAAGVVESDKRARAGRTAFLPGPWTEVNAPDLPLEEAKAAAHLTVVLGKRPYGPFVRLLPPLPPHELFARAWAVSGPRSS
ncbi:hypothetical protein [Streptomyces sp. CBMA152]|uniref:hypothetical protein n=1 Tax=Streptomyces sp. CBMA152 TaxID=1896312 RepID=UPI001660CC69|nr:hypothetical protein [Streptomyces sp. CBMA152]MBD0741064.1 hypothetical protein [Streptomyces sp. CBMA152]